MTTSKLSPTIEDVLDLFLRAPEYEFQDDVKVKGLFQKDLKEMCVPKKLIKRLIKKQKLRYAKVKLKKNGMLVFYSLNEKTLASDLHGKARP